MSASELLQRADELDAADPLVKLARVQRVRSGGCRRLRADRVGLTAQSAQLGEHLTFKADFTLLDLHGIGDADRLVIATHLRDLPGEAWDKLVVVG